MRDPLIKRLPRELREELGKYLVIFLFFVMLIGSVSGFIVADSSMIDAYEEGFEKYNIEDGNFELASEADSDLISVLEEKGGIKLYRNYYKEEYTSPFDSKLRVFGARNEVDKVCIMEGSEPAASDEIALDRLYARNHKLEVGGTFRLEEKELKVCGIAALSDYSALYEKTSDMIFDNDKFGVGVMTDEGFASVRDDHIHYSYSWIYNEKPADDIEAKDKSEELVKVLSENAVLVNYIPEYINQAIVFAGNDMGNDKVSFTAFLYITVAVLAFIFAITTESTIQKESGIIGTLRATGYTRGEIIRHYMILPMTVLLVGAVVGNILGYTLLEKYMASMYYDSYSLPTYTVRFSAEALIKTTLVPFAIMFAVNLAALVRKIRLSPLRFIRHDLSRKQRRKAFRLNTRIGIMIRFRLRIIFQNIPNYITVFIGIFLADAILFFGLSFEPMLDSFRESIIDNQIAENIYILKAPAETSAPGAEKAATDSLEISFDGFKAEDVSIYGITDGSRYVSIDSTGDGVYISSAFRDKYSLDKGDSFTMKEKFGSKEYEFKVAGFYEYPSTIAVFTGLDRFNELFGYESGHYNMYLSSSEITDIDDKLIATRITSDDLTKTSRQLVRSLGDITKIFVGFGVVMFVLVIYLLSKIIVEKNARSISMVKILGYTNSEINSLYVHTTTIVTALSLVLTIPLADRLIALIFKIVFKNYSGYFPYKASPVIMLETFIIGAVSYALIALLLNRRVKATPLAEVLKNVE
ncbi:MAG: ABC transporter permease [Ruminococcus sp.]|nr:ABC transporter permease [Ruminococcus sp.]